MNCACCRRPLPDEDRAFYTKNAQIFAKGGYVGAWCFECCRTVCYRCGHRSSAAEQREFADRRWPGRCIECQESRCHVCKRPTTTQERMDATQYGDGHHNVTCKRCRGAITH
jgi:hypothetical protein